MFVEGARARLTPLEQFITRPPLRVCGKKGEVVHDTAYEIGREFFKTYVSKFAHVLEVGSQDVNGTLRNFAPVKGRYVGIDISPGPAVDVVLDDPYRFPFKQDYFDVVVSSSCFEHDQMFWLTFLEMVRVTKPRGYIYLNVPSNGIYHPYPVDNWRFYPDAALALQRWARRKGKKVTLVECFTARRKQDIWNDYVMIFSKEKNRSGARSRLVDKFPDSFNIRCSSSRTIENFREETEDQILLSEAKATDSGRDAIVRAANDKASSAEARLAEALAEIEMDRVRLAETEREREEGVAALAARDAALAATERRATAQAVAAQAGLARLQTELAARDAAVANAERKMRERAAVAEAMQAEVATLRLRNAMGRAAREVQAIAAMESDLVTLRDALAQTERASQERAAETEAMQAEIVTLRDSLALAERATQERTAETEAMQAEIVTLRDSLAQAERASQEHAAETEAMQAEIVTLRDALAQTERASQERAAETEAMQAEIVTLRDSLALAERATQERTAETEAMQAEIVTLRDWLAQAERASQEHAAETEAMQAEIVTLRDSAGAGRAGNPGAHGRDAGDAGRNRLSPRQARTRSAGACRCCRQCAGRDRHTEGRDYPRRAGGTGTRRCQRGDGTRDSAGSPPTRRRSRSG